MIASGVSTVAGVASGVAGGMALDAAGGAAGGGAGGAAGGGGGDAAPRMSSTANPASSALDAKGTSPGMETEAGKADMNKYNAKAPSVPSGTGADQAPSNEGGGSPAPASKTPSAAEHAPSAEGGSGGGKLDALKRYGD